MKTLRIFGIVLLVAAVGCLVALWRTDAPDITPATLTPAKISEIRSMVQLCTLEVNEEIPVKGRIGKRHLVAKLALEGDVSFDIERLVTEMHADTLRVELPPEIITLREATWPDAYVVLDTWDERPLHKAHFTADEENKLKRMAIDNTARSLYANGAIRQARADAVASLTKLLTTLTDGPVLVVDPSPDGFMNP